MIYNVRGCVVELVEADSEAAAIAELRRQLSTAGFEPYDDPGAGWAFDAFESEEQ